MKPTLISLLIILTFLASYSVKKNIIIFCLLFVGISVFAQNIVPNNSFELYGTCPDAFSPFSNVTGWNSYKETPDYFNSCAAAGTWSNVPSGAFGYQHPSNGNAYAGIGCHGSQGADTVFREYIGRQLSTMFKVGQKYYVSFKVSLADRNSIYCATNNLGVVFSTIPYSSANPAPIRNYAHVYTTAIITDTSNWTTISGTVIADSAYNYIIIGNFFDNQHSTIMKLNSTTSPCFAYYFVDNICVSTDSMTCNGITGINEFDNKNTVVLDQNNPNPFKESTTITYFIPDDVQNVKIVFYDNIGKIIKTVDIHEKGNGILQVYASNLSSGIYTYSIIADGKVVDTKKMVVAK